jgi:hypothetical protein
LIYQEQPEDFVGQQNMLLWLLATTRAYLKTQEPYELAVIESVYPESGGYGVRLVDGCSIYLKNPPIEPQIGYTVKLIPDAQLGTYVRGIDIEGQEVRYQTVDEVAAERRAWSERYARQQKKRYAQMEPDIQRRIKELPLGLQQRMARFKHNSSQFWRYEDYELAALETAAKIYWLLKTPEAIEAYHDMSVTEQDALVPDLNDQLSGNQFEYAIHVAWLLSQDANVAVGHGAMDVIVGCEKYGCIDMHIEDGA